MFLELWIVFVLQINYAFSWDISQYSSIITTIPDSITNEISFHYYNGPGLDDYTVISLADGNKIYSQPTFDPSRKTVFFFHGWSERPSEHNNYSVDILAEAFLQTNSVNFIVINYENLVQHYYNISSWTPDIMNMGAGYVNAVQNTTAIGKSVGYFFKMFVQLCKCEDNLHLIGFSIGAQIISYLAAVYGKGKLKRITGLEAAGPIYSFPGYDHLDIYSGIFIDAIHTDAGVFGYGSSYATVDFWPNFGTAVQPACRSTTVYKCSHYMSVYYYAETIINVYAFKAIECTNQMMWSMFLCDDNTVTHMGYGVSPTTPKGDYFLKTNAESPFGIPDDGGLTFTK